MNLKQKLFFHKKNFNSLEKKLNVINSTDLLTKIFSVEEIKTKRPISNQNSKSPNISSLDNFNEEKNVDFSKKKTFPSNKLHLKNKALKYLPEGVITKILEIPNNKEEICLSTNRNTTEKESLLRKTDGFLGRERKSVPDLKKNPFIKDNKNFVYHTKANYFNKTTGMKNYNIYLDEISNLEPSNDEKKITNFFLNKSKNAGISIVIIIN